MKPILDYNIRKNNPAFYWFICILLSFLAIGIITVSVGVVIEYWNSNVLLIVIMSVFALITSVSLELFIVSMNNAELLIYDDKVVYINSFRRKIVIDGSLSNMEFSGLFRFGIKITNVETNHSVQTYAMWKSVFLFEEFKNKNIVLKLKE